MENATTTDATQNQTEVAAPKETPATLLAQAGTGTGEQTPPAETQTTQSTEKPATETTTTTEKPAAETKPADGVPEKYEFKAPEGQEYAPEVVESFSAAAKKINLTQAQAQQLIEEMAPALVARQVDQISAIHEEWATTSRKDAEFGGEKFQENLAVAKKAYVDDKLVTPELRTLLENTGLGNHPEVIRLLYRIGQRISEDKFVGGTSSRAGATDPYAVLYDKTQPQK